MGGELRPISWLLASNLHSSPLTLLRRVVLKNADNADERGQRKGTVLQLLYILHNRIVSYRHCGCRL